MGANSGRRGGRWVKLKAEVRARRGNCCRCGMPIDYDLTWPDPDSFSVDHFPYSKTKHPEYAEDPGNLAAAHLKCNQEAGDRPPRPSLGVMSEEW